MRAWLRANGGPLALVVIGLGVGGITNRWIGLALIGAGLLWFLSEIPFIRSRIPGFRSLPAPPIAPEPTVNLSFGDPYVDPQVQMVNKPVPGIGAAVSASATSSHVAGITRFASFAFVRVVNNQSSPGVGVVATHALAYTTYYDADGSQLLGKIQGRWRESPHPSDLSPYQTHPNKHTIELAPNGQPHELDIAFKYPEEEDCYAYNDVNALYAQSKVDQFRFSAREIWVKVEVMGGNFYPPLVGWFILTNPGANGVLKIQRGRLAISSGTTRYGTHG